MVSDAERARWVNDLEAVMVGEIHGRVGMPFQGMASDPERARRVDDLDAEIRLSALVHQSGQARHHGVRFRCRRRSVLNRPCTSRSKIFKCTFGNLTNSPVIASERDPAAPTSAVAFNPTSRSLTGCCAHQASFISSTRTAHLRCYACDPS